jgi:hypothetical protein
MRASLTSLGLQALARYGSAGGWVTGSRAGYGRPHAAGGRWRRLCEAGCSINKGFTGEWVSMNPPRFRRFDLPKARKDEQGRWICRGCQQPIMVRRRTSWCTDE